MYYRRKIELALLQSFGSELGKLDFQKLLFLLTRLQKKAVYDFVPYKFGCFSFHSNADLLTMVKYGMVEESKGKNETWIKSDDTDYLNLINPSDRAALNKIKEQFDGFNTDDLLKYVYRNFPYYAINSTIADSILSHIELKKVRESKPKSTNIALYSIGYEGISLETYLNKLIEHDIRVLCDVRKNSFSMKYGFSKNQLSNACNGLGIKFIHLPELGIESDKRRKLNDQSDYENLFSDYRTTTLANEKEKINQVAELVTQHKRVAITCFEADIHQCHRKHLAEKIVSLPGWCHELIHL